MVERIFEVDASSSGMVERIFEVDASSTRVVARVLEVDSSTVRTVGPSFEPGAARLRMVARSLELGEVASGTVARSLELGAASLRIFGHAPKRRASTTQPGSATDDSAAEASPVVEDVRDRQGYRPAEREGFELCKQLSPSFLIGDY
jgi:hypothetical protein